MLGDERWLAWYAQAKMNARLLEDLTAEQERRTGLPAAWFDVLAHLCPEGAGPVRMNQLADELVVSRGGATRIIAPHGGGGPRRARDARPTTAAPPTRS